MTADEFVDAIRLVVQDAAVDGTVALLETPPRRCSDQSLLDAGRWFRQLDPADRARVERIVTIAVHQAVFGLLCVLDGVRVVESGAEAGRLVLVYRKDGQDLELNAPDGAMLHELFGASPPSRATPAAGGSGK